MPTVFLLVCLVGAWFTYNVYRPVTRSGALGAVSFFAGWLTGELALHHIAWQVLFTLGFVSLGALSAWPGWLGLAISLGSWGALAHSYHRARDAERVVEEALEATLGRGYRDAIRGELRERLPDSLDWRELLLPFPMRDPRVERIRDVRYGRAAGRNLMLDVYRPRALAPGERGWPVLLQVHGGGWVIGSKNEQGIPLMLRLAAHGWLCVSIDYRLSPAATFPDHLIDVKRAIAWIREHAVAYGGDPAFVVVTGGSAGGHLASLAALTPDDPEYQPGFEQVSTALQGCVSFYGVYDFTNRNGVYRDEGLKRLLERWVMKASLDEARGAYERASPVYRVTPDAPPFFVVHGDRDTLVPVADARHFAAELRATSRAPVIYAEIPGAQHAFEIFPSLRCLLAIDGVERFLFYLYSEWLRARTVATVAAAVSLDGNGGRPPAGLEEAEEAEEVVRSLSE